MLQEMLRERMVASSRGSPGRLTDGASSKMKCTWQGNGSVMDLVGTVVQRLEYLGVQQADEEIVG